MARMSGHFFDGSKESEEEYTTYILDKELEADFPLGAIALLSEYFMRQGMISAILLLMEF